MSEIIRRRYFEELAMLMQKTVTVITTDGRIYVGSLIGYEPETMSLCLSNAKDDKGNLTRRVFLNGAIVAQLLAAEKPFDLKSLADRLEKVFPRMVRLYEEAGVIVVMDKIRVGEKGILEGVGPSAERVQRVYDEFMREKAKS